MAVFGYLTNDFLLGLGRRNCNLVSGSV